MGGGEGSAGARNRNVFARASMLPRCRTGHLGLLPPTRKAANVAAGRLRGNCAANGRHVAIRLNSANNRQLIEDPRVEQRASRD
jgi:hypothetical protein